MTPAMTCRCFAMKANFIALPSQISLLPFQDVALRPQFGVLAAPAARTSSCSDFSCPWPGKAYIRSALKLLRQQTPEHVHHGSPDPAPAYASADARSQISRTASTLNSRANTRLPMGHLQRYSKHLFSVSPKPSSRPDRARSPDRGRILFVSAQTAIKIESEIDREHNHPGGALKGGRNG